VAVSVLPALLSIFVGTLVIAWWPALSTALPAMLARWHVADAGYSAPPFPTGNPRWCQRHVPVPHRPRDRLCPELLHRLVRRNAGGGHRRSRWRLGAPAGRSQETWA